MTALLQEAKREVAQHLLEKRDALDLGRFSWIRKRIRPVEIPETEVLRLFMDRERGHYTRQFAMSLKAPRLLDPEAMRFMADTRRELQEGRVPPSDVIVTPATQRLHAEAKDQILDSLEREGFISRKIVVSHMKAKYRRSVNARTYIVISPWQARKLASLVKKLLH